MIKKIIAGIKKLEKITNPVPQIGGLEIDNSSLRFTRIKNGELELVSLRLPAGVIKDGRLDDEENFKKILTALHSKIANRPKKKIYVIVDILNNSVYAQVFNLPLVAKANIAESARLNLQMISPIDFRSAYADWQVASDKDYENGQLEILGAFVPKNLVDNFIKCLKETNFVIAAVEFPALAVARLVDKEWFNSSPDQSLILLRLSSSDLSFSILRKGNLYFNYSTVWSDETILLKDLEAIILRETQKVLNFHASHWQAPVNNIAVLAPSEDIEDKMVKTLKENFSLQTHKFKEFLPRTINNVNLSSIAPEWLVAVGSALRGLLPRDKDDIISLAPVGTEEEFRQGRIVNFLNFWRNIILTVLVFLVILFSAGDFFLSKIADSLKGRLANTNSLAETKELADLENQADAFNGKVDLILGLRGRTMDWTPFMEKMETLADDNGILMDRLIVPSANAALSFFGRAQSEAAIINFKNTLVQDSEFASVDLPLASISQPASGLISFIVNFRIKNQ